MRYGTGMHHRPLISSNMLRPPLGIPGVLGDVTLWPGRRELLLALFRPSFGSRRPTAAQETVSWPSLLTTGGVQRPSLCRAVV